MRRRDFITLLAGAAAWPVAAHAQQPAVPVVGFLGAGAPGPYAPLAAAFVQGLKESGYVDGQNVAIEYRWGDSQGGRLPALAADLVRRQVAVIAATGGAGAGHAAKGATKTIPIVFQTGRDPVEDGLVTSLARPTGNITGVALFNVELVPKRLELLHELVPKGKVTAALVDTTIPGAEPRLRDLQAAASTLGLQLHVLPASTEGDLQAALATLTKQPADALLISTSNFFTSRSEQLAEFTLRHALPSIYGFRQFPAAGGLMSYGGSATDAYRLTGVYVGRILKGEKPADLPVLQPTKFEMVINLKTAKALDLTVPPSLLAIADEVIE